MVKVLFLDIDGVLTSERVHVALNPHHQRGLVWHNFDPIAIGFLNRLNEEVPNLQFVLSSSWRDIWNQQTITMFLSQAGWRGVWHQNWKIGKAISRGIEVDEWVKEHKPESYLILDDISDNGWFNDQKERLVLTDGRNGMNDIKYFYQCKTILKKKLKG